MDWTVVAGIGLICLMVIITTLTVTAISSAYKDAKAKRDIEYHKAGLMPPGWK